MREKVHDICWNIAALAIMLWGSLIENFWTFGIVYAVKLAFWQNKILDLFAETYNRFPTVGELDRLKMKVGWFITAYDRLPTVEEMKLHVEQVSTAD